MRCEEIQNRLSAYLEDEVEPGERRAIEEHLPECARCQHELDLIRQTVSALTSLAEIEVPARLTASIQAAIETQKTSRWRDVASRIFFPLHIKLPLEAVALVLVALGAVYLFRSTPEMARSPQSPVVTEAFRGRGTGQIAGARRDMDETTALRQSDVKTEANLDDEQGQEVLGKGKPSGAEEPQAKALEKKKEKEVGLLRFGVMRKEAPASSNVAAPVRELVLRTDNPSQATSRIAEIAAMMGGKLLEERGDHQQLILTVPAQEYQKFLAALRELGTPVDLPGEATETQPSTPPGTMTLRLRLVP